MAGLGGVTNHQTIVYSKQIRPKSRCKCRGTPPRWAVPTSRTTQPLVCSRQTRQNETPMQVHSFKAVLGSQKTPCHWSTLGAPAKNKTGFQVHPSKKVWLSNKKQCRAPPKARSCQLQKSPNLWCVPSIPQPKQDTTPATPHRIGQTVSHATRAGSTPGTSGNNKTPM